MITFFEGPGKHYAVESDRMLNDNDLQKLTWLFGNARLLPTLLVAGKFIGPRKEMITPWSTNAVEITQNMGISGIRRIEEFENHESRIKNHYPSTTTTFVLPIPEIVTSPGTYGTGGFVQRKTHLASSGCAFTQPCDFGTP